MSADPASFLAKTHDLRMAAPSTVVSLQVEHQAELERLFRALDRSSRIVRGVGYSFNAVVEPF
jgi:hypothetical protein